MAKQKLQRFAQNKTFQHVFEPTMEEAFNKDYQLKGKWRSKVFKNDNPIVLELGCGKGEYSVGLAKKYPNKNCIGIDIKGARIWYGAKESLDLEMKNIAFIRTRIEFIESFFAKDEIDEIWLTFSDPQPQDSREKKRLTSPRFINRYKTFLKPNGIVHMKTDNTGLFDYTLEQIQEHNYRLIESTHNLYEEHIQNLDPDTQEILGIKTHYETIFSEKGFKIKYCKFRL